jgi:Holliday junction resolvase-like predicted endonuclease
MLYNFRFDRSRRQEVLRRLQEEGVLCQGWGGGAKENLDMTGFEDFSDFYERTSDLYNRETTHLASNLARIRDFEDGDLLVTPNLPENGDVSIHVVEGDFPECYTYREDDETHLNHCIRVSASYGLDRPISASNEQVAAWKAKLPWMRYPVLPRPQYEDDFQQIIQKRDKDPQAKLDASPLMEFLERLQTQFLEKVREKLGSIAPSGEGITFEDLCARLLTSAGYEVSERNQYDREGGDVDLVCTRELSSPFETSDTDLLYVQVKKHEGETGEHAVRQVAQMVGEESQARGCVMSLADDFSEEAQKLAEDYDIKLIGGHTVALLALQELGTIQPDVL